MSEIWQFFKRGKSTATCNVCKKEMSLGHERRKMQTTTSIKNHLRKLHPSDYRKYCAAAEDALQIKKRKVASTAKAVHAIDTPNQPTLEAVMSHQNLWPDDHPVSKKIDQQIMDLIVVDLQPYNIVEGAAFKRLNFACPDQPHKYRLKTEKFFRTTVMPATFEKVKKKVVPYLEKAEWISFTTDIWTCPNATCSLLSYTAHMLDGPKRVKVILAAKVLEENHTGLAIAEDLEKKSQKNIMF